MPTAMDSRYITSTGLSIQLGARIGSGGEGNVFECVGYPDLVAKIYHKVPVPEHASKLQTMASMCTGELEQIAAWPSQTITNTAGGPLVGVLMRRIPRDFREIINLYNPNDRKKYFASVDFSFLAHTAWNLAAAFETMHKAGVVIGDVNQKNILVNPQAYIRLIDCDSFQVTHNGQKFRCRVGVPDYTPPELQGKNFAQVDRSQNHDNFGLAVIIFSLLMMGRHPFAGVAIGRNPIDLMQAIQGYHFAYGNNGSAGVLVPPPNAPPLDILSGKVITLLEQAFSKSAAANQSRPSSEEWLKTLDRFKAEMLTCPKNGIHRFGQHRSTCPWCELESRAIVFFTGTAKQMQAAAGLTLNNRLVTTLRHQISQLQVLGNPLSSSLPAVVGLSIDDEIIAARRTLKSVRICFVLFILCSWLGWLGSSGSFVFIIFLIWWINEESDKNAFKREKQRRKNVYDRCSGEFQKTMEMEKTVQSGLPKMQGTVENTIKLLDEYENMPTRFQNEKRQLETQKRKIQEKHFLQRYTIDAASIPNFGPHRKAILRSFGLYTAADIEKAAISSIPGIGETLQESLLDWRKNLLQGFTYNASKPIPQSEVDALRTKFSSRAGVLETELKARRNKFAVELSCVEQQWTQLVAEHARISQLFAQAKADLEVIAK